MFHNCWSVGFRSYQEHREILHQVFMFDAPQLLFQLVVYCFNLVKVIGTFIALVTYLGAKCSFRILWTLFIFKSNMLPNFLNSTYQPNYSILARIKQTPTYFFSFRKLCEFLQPINLIKTIAVSLIRQCFLYLYDARTAISSQAKKITGSRSSLEKRVASGAKHKTPCL